MRIHSFAMIVILSSSSIAYASEQDIGTFVDERAMAQLRATTKMRLGIAEMMLLALPGIKDMPRMEASRIPDKAKEDALLWIPKVINERWLPGNWESNLVGFKGVILQEHRVTSGGTFLELAYDIIMIKGNISEHEIAVMETGDCVMLLVKFPSEQNATSDTAGYIERCLRKFVNIPSVKIIREDMMIKSELPLITAESRSGRIKLKEKGIIPDHWWEYPVICASERFFFVVVVKFTPEDAQKQYCRPWNPHRF